VDTHSATQRVTRSSAAARLDRLPIGSFHKGIMWMMAYIFFFELSDLNTFGFAAPAIRIAWKLPLSTIGVITSAAFIGMLVGANCGGWFSDRVGRKRALIVTTLFYSLFSLLNALAWDVTGLFVTRLLTGVGISAMTVVGMTYISEMFPVKRRGSYQAWIMMIGVCGIPATAFVARAVIPMAVWGWRLVFIWGALGMLILFFMSRLEESPRWFENQGRLEEADAALDRIEARVRTQFGELPPISDIAPPIARSGKYSELFTAAIRGRTALLVSVWFFEALGFYGAQAWIPTLLVAKGFSLVHSLSWTSAMQLGAPVGAMLAGVISDRWDRKWLVTICVLIKALFAILYGLSNTQGTIVLFGFLMMISFQMFTPILYAYTAECFPTHVRNSGAGISYGAGRGANSFGPLIVAMLFSQLGYNSVFVYIAAMFAAVAVIVAIFGPQTKGRVLV
jgi:putative MFS transporter